MRVGANKNEWAISRRLRDGTDFGSGRLSVDKEQIKVFATEFDPQPFHLDEEAARDTIFQGLVASGWHTAALTMRLLVKSEITPVGGIVGAGFDEFRWPRPVRPGDEWRRISLESAGDDLGAGGDDTAVLDALTAL
jgi:acyl dehydratase